MRKINISVLLCMSNCMNYSLQDGLILYDVNSSWSLIWEIALKAYTRFFKSHQDSVPYPFALIYLGRMIRRRYFVLRSFYIWHIYWNTSWEYKKIWNISKSNQCNFILFSSNKIFVLCFLYTKYLNEDKF